MKPQKTPPPSTTRNVRISPLSTPLTPAEIESLKKSTAEANRIMDEELKKNPLKPSK